MAVMVMKFWLNFFDLSKDRKIKGFILATVLLCLGKIDNMTWAAAFTVFVAANQSDKFLDKMKGE